MNLKKHPLIPAPPCAVRVRRYVRGAVVEEFLSRDWKKHLHEWTPENGYLLLPAAPTIGEAIAAHLRGIVNLVWLRLTFPMQEAGK